jgi:hypothetical protein
MTKAAQIRRLLSQGKSFNEVCVAVGTSYPYVNGIWTSLGREGRNQALRAAAGLVAAKRAFPVGSRVVHKRQVNKRSFGVVVESTRYTTRVSFTYRHPAKQDHNCVFYETPCMHDPKKEGKLLPAVAFKTVDLEVAPNDR